jgi:hypothetical protein
MFSLHGRGFLLYSLPSQAMFFHHTKKIPVSLSHSYSDCQYLHLSMVLQVIAKALSSEIQIFCSSVHYKSQCFGEKIILFVDKDSEVVV